MATKRPSEKSGAILGSGPSIHSQNKVAHGWDVEGNLGGKPSPTAIAEEAIIEANASIDTAARTFIGRVLEIKAGLRRAAQMISHREAA